MRDRFGREVDNLRLAITPECNLSCFFCHQEGYGPNICSIGKGGNELSVEEIVQVVKVAERHGINRVKLTGGEPLLRTELGDIIEGIRQIQGIKELSMVTNGILLEDRLEEVKNLDRINVSLHTSNPVIFEKITGYDLHSKVVKGIRKAVEVGIPVKVNMTVIEDLNSGEVPEMVDLAKSMGTNLQIIEYHSQNQKSNLNFRIDEVEKWLVKNAENESELYDNRRKQFLVDGIKINLVRPMFNADFCKGCHRMRVTPDGQFKPCLLRTDNHVKFDAGDEIEVEDAFLKAIEEKEPFFKERK